MNAPASGASLVVVALDAVEREDYAIELACTLSHARAPELLGLFVESTELLAHARSRWAREFLLSGSERALDERALERQLRSQAARVRARFEATTARLGVRHRFEIARGGLFTEPVKRAAAAEVLVVSLARAVAGGFSVSGFLRELRETHVPKILFARQGWLTGQSIAVVVDEATPATQAAIEAAARVARRSGSPVTALVPAGPEGANDEVEQHIARALARHGVEASHVIRLSGADTARIIQAARACRARLLVMPAPEEAGDAAAIDELLRRFSGALMLVRQ